MKIVVVDDDEMYQKTLAHQLKAKYNDKLEVQAFDSGEKMLLFLNPNSKPDLVVLDYFLELNPYSINGYEILKALKKMTPETKVVMVTGGSNSGHEDDFMSSGADGFIIKDGKAMDKICQFINNLK